MRTFAAQIRFSCLVFAPLSVGLLLAQTALAGVCANILVRNSDTAILNPGLLHNFDDRQERATVLLSSVHGPKLSQWTEDGYMVCTGRPQDTYTNERGTFHVSSCTLCSSAGDVDEDGRVDQNDLLTIQYFGWMISGRTYNPNVSYFQSLDYAMPDSHTASNRSMLNSDVGGDGSKMSLATSAEIIRQYVDNQITRMPREDALVFAYAGSSSTLLLGDANLNGSLSFADVFRVVAQPPLTGRAFDNADVNGDGVLNSIDQNMIANKLGLLIPAGSRWAW